MSGLLRSHSMRRSLHRHPTPCTGWTWPMRSPTARPRTPNPVPWPAPSGLPTTGSTPAEKFDDPLGLSLPPAALPFLDAWKRPEELVQGAPSIPVVLLRPPADGGGAGAGGGAGERKGARGCPVADTYPVSCSFLHGGCMALSAMRRGVKEPFHQTKHKLTSHAQAQALAAAARPRARAPQRRPTAIWRGGSMRAMRALSGCLLSSMLCRPQRCAWSLGHSACNSAADRRFCSRRPLHGAM